MSQQPHGENHGYENDARWMTVRLGENDRRNKAGKSPAHVECADYPMKA